MTAVELIPRLTQFAQVGKDGGDFVTILLFGFLLIVGIIVLIFVGMFASVAALWFRGFMPGANVGPLQMVVMKLKKVSPNVIVESRIMARQAGLENITTNQMESHYLAGGNGLSW